MGRAARNENGRVILFAKKMTNSMQKAIDTTTQRRKKQEEFNAVHNITPKTVKRRLDENLRVEDHGELANRRKKIEKMPPSQRKELIRELTKKMHEAAKTLEFEKAAALRDEIMKLREL